MRSLQKLDVSKCGSATGLVAEIWKGQRKAPISGTRHLRAGESEPATSRLADTLHGLHKFPLHNYQARTPEATMHSCAWLLSLAHNRHSPS